MAMATERRPTRPWARRAAWALATGVGLLAMEALLAAQTPPLAVSRFDINALEGPWFAAASAGNSWDGRCLTDTRYVFALGGPGRATVSSACTTTGRVVTRRGRLRSSQGDDGRLAIQFSPRLVRWLPAAWSDFWVLGGNTDRTWIVVGDRRRQHLVVLSRTVALDEASFAAALAVARREGYDVAQVARVAQPAGPSSLLGRR